jgi:hypothetical protein
MSKLWLDSKMEMRRTCRCQVIDEQILQGHAEPVKNAHLARSKVEDVSRKHALDDRLELRALVFGLVNLLEQLWQQQESRLVLLCLRTSKVVQSEDRGDDRKLRSDG